MKKLRFLIVPLIIVGLSVVVVLLFGNVSGEEFSAQKFSQRHFSYYQIPLLRTQLTPVTFRQSFNTGQNLTKHLKSVGLLGDVTSNPIRWDVVYINEVGRKSSHGDAEILTKYFDHWGAVGGANWLTWTQKSENAEVAANLWPLVARLADENLYILIPDLFDEARATTDAEIFLDRVKPMLLDSIERLADIEAANERPKESQELQTLATDIRSLQAREIPNRVVEDMKQREKAEAEDVDAEADPEDIP